MTKQWDSFLAVVLLVTIALGCVNNNTEPKTLYVSMDIPNAVYGSQEFTAYVDMDNQGNRTYRNLKAEFFNTGSFDKVSSCSFGPYTFLPNDKQALECKMKYGKEVRESLVERVDANVIYDSSYNAMTGFEVMSLKRYEQAKAIGTYRSMATTSSYSNDEIEVSMELSENPIINRADNKNFVYFSINNIGKGFIDNIEGSDITLRSVPEGAIINCDTPSLLMHDNNEFPKITCELATTSIDSYGKVDVFINIFYSYELRQTGNIRVIR